MKLVIETEYECPHCGYGYIMEGDSSIYTDHITDECALKCEDCGEWYQLQCQDVEVHLAATKAPDSVIPKCAAEARKTKPTKPTMLIVRGEDREDAEALLKATSHKAT